MHGADGTILHADLDSFFASVEQRDNPRLLGKPIAVGGGVVTAASYEAKAFGVTGGMGGWTAKKLCPGLIFVKPRFEAYTAASKAVFKIFNDTSPLVEGLSIDEAFIDVRGMERIAGTPAEIAERLRVRVRDKVGLPITVGVARTKFLAKVASAQAKPDGLLVVPVDGELEFLHPLPVEALWGVGKVTAGKLHARGIMTVAQVAELPRGDAGQPRRQGVGASAARARARAGRAPRDDRRPPALHRRSARARPSRPQDARGAGRHARRAGGPDRPAPARREPHVPDDHPAPALRRLLARDPLAHAGGAHRRQPAAARRRARRCSRA